MRKNQSVMTAASRSPGLAPGRLRPVDRQARPRTGRTPPAATDSVGSSMRSMVLAATRNSRASSRFDPISSGTFPPWPAAIEVSGAAGRTEPSTVGANGSRLSASCPHRAGSGAV